MTKNEIAEAISAALAQARSLQTAVRGIKEFLHELDVDEDNGCSFYLDYMVQRGLEQSAQDAADIAEELHALIPKLTETKP